jgi:hypothetical protein
MTVPLALMVSMLTTEFVQDVMIPVEPVTLVAENTVHHVMPAKSLSMVNVTVIPLVSHVMVLLIVTVFHVNQTKS